MPQALQGPLISDPVAIGIIVTVLLIGIGMMCWNYCLQAMHVQFVSQSERIRNCYDARCQLMLLDMERYRELPDPTFMLHDSRFTHLRTQLDFMTYYQSEQWVEDKTIE